MYREFPALKKLREKSISFIAAGIVLLILGILLSDIPTMIASSKWPTTAGIISSRTLSGVSFEEYDGNYYTRIEGYIRYQYTAEGKSYTGASINAISSPNYPYDLVINYPEGKEVTVHYNPNDPNQAVLEPGLVCSSKAFDLFASFLLIAGVYLLGVSLSRLWKGLKQKSRIFPGDF